MTHTRANPSSPARAWFTAILPLLLAACTNVDAPTDAAAKPPPLYYPGVGNPFIVQQISAVSLQYLSEVDAGSSGAAITINWLQGQDQQVLLTADDNVHVHSPPRGLNEAAPPYPGRGGYRFVTWPASVKWPGGTAFTMAAAGGDIVSCFYNGSAN